MVITSHLLILLLSSYGRTINVPIFEQHQDLQSCVSQILSYHFQNKITYVDMNYDKNDIIKLINSVSANIISRNTAKEMFTYNAEYVITAGTPKDFTLRFPHLMKESRTNYYAYFLIVVQSLNSNDLPYIFDALLRYRVNNVLVVNATNEPVLFTYDPFDNYNCGKKYDSIIELGKCLNVSLKHLYPNKLVTGLRNCTFKATVANWPPYAIDPKNTVPGKPTLGVEQYVFDIIRKLEGFKVKYTTSINGEDFSTVGENKSSGNLVMLRAKQTDFMFGGMLLVDFRADAFNFIWGHLPYKDDIRVFVQKAGPVESWKSLILEFDCTVWLILIGTFVSFFVLLLAMLRVKDKSHLFLVMFDIFFLHGHKMVSKSRRLLIFWVIYCYLINSYYQSSLVSITTNPIMNYQIQTQSDLRKYNIESCVSVVLQKYIMIVRSEYLQQIHYNEGCIYLMDSMQSVSKSKQKYTVSLLSLYLYNKYLYKNEKGEELIYPFKHPMNKVIYAIYFHKGFPLRDRLNLHTFRLRENGLIDKYLQKLYEERERRFVKNARTRIKNHLHIVFALYVLLAGVTVALGVLLIEVGYYKISLHRRATLL